MKQVKAIVLKITYDDEYIGDPGNEWDWTVLLNQTGHGPGTPEHVKVRVLSCTDATEDK